MRAISAAALTKLLAGQGEEPVNVVEIQWHGAISYFYADKSYRQYGVYGKILELSNLENVVNVNDSSSSQSISLKLDDTDGTLKQIYNFNDIQKRPVNVYQWFSGLHFDDKFLIFQGEINSPIVWSEGDRTLSFEIVSKLEDKEVGYSAEEGQYAVIPDELIGKAWPLPFGTCLQVPALKLDPIPTGGSLDTNAVPDPSIDDQINNLSQRALEAGGWAQLSFIYAIQAYNSGFGGEDNYWQGIGDQWTDQGNQYLQQAWQIQQEIANLTGQKAAQLAKQKNSMRVSGGSCFPQDTPVTTKLNGVPISGRMQGEFFTIDGMTHPAKEATGETGISTVPVEQTIGEGGQEIIQKLDMAWIPSGLPFKLTSDLPVRYIVSMIPVTITNVWSYRNYNDARILTRVPLEYYSIGAQSFGSVVATIITLQKPLSYYDEGWDDNLYVDMVSAIGPNLVDIMVWLIETYTSLGIDVTSFNQVRSRVSGFPCNFCLLERKNIVQFLSEIAYQGRCAIWMNNGIFYLRYLVDEPAYVDTIDEDDLVLNSLEIHHTSTEELVTKYVATYRTSYAQEKSYKIILRNNVPKYGTHEQSYDYYIYTHPDAVDLASTFWLIRKSNTWKILKFRTPLHKLRIETFDAILLNFTSRYASIGPITGIVQSVHFDSEKLELEFDVWLPIRLGEMSKYDFAWPVDDAVKVFPNELAFKGSGGPGEQTDGDLTPANGTCEQGVRVNFEKQNLRVAIHDGHPNPGQESVQGSAIVQGQVTGLDRTRQPATNYNYRNYRVSSPANKGQATPGSYPGKVISESSGIYTISTYLKGLANSPTQMKAQNVTPENKASAGDWVFVHIIVWTIKTNEDLVQKSAAYFMPGGGKPGGYAARVLSGSGRFYQVQIFKNGTTAASETVEAEQLQIDPSETIPVGTWAIAVEANVTSGGETTKKYYIQVPIWVE